MCRADLKGSMTHRHYEMKAVCQTEQISKKVSNA